MEFPAQGRLRLHQVVELFAVEGKKNGDLSRCFAVSVFENFHCARHDDLQLVAFVAFVKNDLAGGIAFSDKAIGQSGER